MKELKEILDSIINEKYDRPELHKKSLLNTIISKIITKNTILIRYVYHPQFYNYQK